MIYTGYYGNLKNIPDNVYKISISLKTPFGMNFYNCKELCPTLEILSSYKDGIIDENGYNTLLGVYVQDMIDEANNYHATTETSSTGSSE